VGRETNLRLRARGAPPTVVPVTDEILRGVREANRLMDEGVPGEARVLGVSDTGATLNFDPVCELRLQVSLPGEAPYETSIRQAVPRSTTERLALGTLVPVRVDADDVSRVVVDHRAYPLDTTSNAAAGLGRDAERRWTPRLGHRAAR
jgi:hypothetical protein